jgi:hypothetical protein
MAFLYQDSTLLMEWCLECHRAPENHLRPRREVFSMTWRPEDEGYDQRTLGAELKEEYHVRSLTSCSTCHR